MQNGQIKGRSRFLSGVMAIGLCALTPCGAAFAQAAMAADTPAFRALGATVRADGATAETCVTFSEAPGGDAQSWAGQLQIQREGKKLAVDPQYVRLSGSELCVGDLDHGASYDMRIARGVSADGRKLVKTYAFSFDVPHRKPLLSFVMAGDPATFPRHAGKSEDSKVHLLRSVNVQAARLTLYKIEESGLVAEAWQQFTQNARTPSEGLYFARTKGKSVFESELVLGDKPDKDQSLNAPLPADTALAPGLYFLSAVPRGQHESNPGLVAGQWFVVSDLRAGAVMTDKALEAFVANQSGNQPVAGATVSVLSRKGKVLAEGRSDAQGRVSLKLEPQERAQAALLLASRETGDVDLLDMERAGMVALAAPLPKVSLQTDLDRYASGARAVISLRAQDAKGAALAKQKGTLRLLRPDKRVHSQQEVEIAGGVARAVLTLPVAQETGFWTLEWSGGDEGLLASATVRIEAQGASGRVEMETPAFVSGGEKVFAVRAEAFNDEGQPLAFASGKLVVRPVRVRSEAWKEYRFGLPAEAATSAGEEIPFLADAQGRARVSVKSDALGPDVLALEITPVLEGGAMGETRTVKLGARQVLVGIRAMQGDRVAPGVTVARLGLVALDGEGRKKPVSGLSYALIEEGRSFEWYPADGYWDYKPLPQRRRIAGGALNLGGDGEALVQLPLTPGQYAMEVAQGDGRLLARTDFVVGPDGSLDGRTEAPAFMKWQKTPAFMEPKKQQTLTLRLERDAMLAFVAADHQIRHVQYKALKAGVHSFTLQAGDDWGPEVTVRALALTDRQAEPAVLESKIGIRDARRAIELSLSAPSTPAVGGQSLSLPLRAVSAGRPTPAHVSVVATPVPTDKTQSLEPIFLNDVRLDANGKGTLVLPVPVFDGTLRVAVSASGEKEAFGTRLIELPVARALTVKGRTPARMVQGDQAEVYLTFVNSNGPDAAYSYEIKVPDGLVLKGGAKGHLALGRQASQTLAFSLEAKAPILDQIELVARSASGVQQRFVWPVVVRGAGEQGFGHQVLSLAPDATQTLPETKQGGIALLAPVDLPPSTMRLLHTLATRAPVTTVELSLWLEAAALWHKPLVESGLVGAGRFEEIRAERLQLLQRRQNEDGGFASTRSGRSSDLASTAAALKALAGQVEEPTQRASSWLVQKLQNTWFDEAERPVRALAFEALDSIGKADVSGVRYFAETSRDKTLPAPAVSALASIFSRSTQDEDKAKATDWTNRYRAMDDASDWRAAVFAARNTMLRVEDWGRLHAADIDPARETSLEDAATVLTAYARAAARSGTWRIELDGVQAKHHGVTALPLKAQKIRNSSDKPLAVTVFSREAKRSAAGEDALRGGPKLDLQLWGKDGARIGAGQPLAVGETYFLTVSVTGRVSGEKTARLTVPVSGAFEARTAPLGAEAQVRDDVPALPAPDAPLDRSVTGEAVRWTFDATKPWTGIVILRAQQRGSFVWPAPLLETEDGEKRAAPYEALRVMVK